MSTTKENVSAVIADPIGDLLTAADLAKRLRVKASYLEWLRHRHGLPYVRLGSKVRFRLHDVNDWLERRATPQSTNGGMTTAGSSGAKRKVRMMTAHWARPAQWENLHKHIIALACYRGTNDDPLEEAYKEVLDSAGRKVLLAVFAVARQMTEADYYRRHSALADSDATEQAAQAQIREAHENRDMRLNNIVNELLGSIPKYIEEPLARVADGEALWAGQVVEGLTQVAIDVSAIRELCPDQIDQGSPASEAITDTRDECV